MKYTLIVIALAALLGCATSKKINGPNGQPAHSIRCGAARPDTCLEKAGEVCPDGYLVLNSKGSQFLGQFGSGSVNGAWGTLGGSVHGSSTSIPLISPNIMLVECKEKQ